MTGLLNIYGSNLGVSSSSYVRLSLVVTVYPRYLLKMLLNIAHVLALCGSSKYYINNNNNNNNIYSGSSTHRSVFQGGPVIYIYIIHGKLYYAYLKTIKYLQVDYI
jgi:hypothetical protein